MSSITFVGLPYRSLYFPFCITHCASRFATTHMFLQLFLALVFLRAVGAEREDWDETSLYMHSVHQIDPTTQKWYEQGSKAFEKTDDLFDDHEQGLYKAGHVPPAPTAATMVTNASAGGVAIPGRGSPAVLEAIMGDLEATPPPTSACNVSSFIQSIIGKSKRSFVKASTSFVQQPLFFVSVSIFIIFGMIFLFLVMLPSHGAESQASTPTQLIKPSRQETRMPQQDGIWTTRDSRSDAPRWSIEHRPWSPLRPDSAAFLPAAQHIPGQPTAGNLLCTEASFGRIPTQKEVDTQRFVGRASHEPHDTSTYATWDGEPIFSSASLGPAGPGTARRHFCTQEDESDVSARSVRSCAEGLSFVENDRAEAELASPSSLPEKASFSAMTTNTLPAVGGQRADNSTPSGRDNPTQATNGHQSIRGTRMS
eukprot:TRINITY_DN55164_c0_g1_i1.p1 TRINITY_DN55164_c0_g1~~TRINITY_DN55164_c0_g1_i1.p1  ORF type:complete len:424 (+),score=44.56 TRINITY_DN55164_c0_g1_i1:79-1350(+)